MAKWRALRWLLWSGLAAVGLLVVAALSSPLWLRPLVERQASSILGRPVTMGRLQLRPGTPVVVTAEQVVVGNPANFPAEFEPFARLPRLTLQLDAGAYVRRREIVISAIELDRPVVRAASTEDGRDNYRFDVGSALAGSKDGPKIGTLRILDGRARVSLAGLRADFELAAATQEQTGPEPPAITAEGHGTYAGQPLTARLVAGALLNLRDTSKPFPIELQVTNAPTRAFLKGTVQDPLSLRAASVGLLLAGPDMELLTPLFGIPFPPTPPYELGGKLEYADSRFHLTDVAGRMGHSDVEGALTVTVDGEQPVLAAELRSRSLDLRDIVGLLSDEPGPPGTPGQTPKQADRAAQVQAEVQARPRLLPDGLLNLSKLKAIDVQLDYRAERIQGRSVPLDNLTLQMDIVNGAVTLHPLSFGVGRGRIAGDVALTPGEGHAVQARTEVRFERVDFARLMRATGGYQGGGVLSGTARVEGTGRSIAEILGRGDGVLTLSMADGDLSKLLADLVGLRLGSALLSSLGGPSRTRVACFVADLALHRGMLATRALLLETADAVTEGHGAVDLGRERVEIRLQTKSKRLTVGVLPGPLLINGALKSPSVAPAASWACLLSYLASSSASGTIRAANA